MESGHSLYKSTLTNGIHHAQLKHDGESYNDAIVLQGSNGMVNTSKKEKCAVKTSELQNFVYM